jgi:flagellar hook-associated protein 2
MQITGSYMNYLSVSNLLSSLGVKSSSDLVMNVFNQSVEQLQEKVGQQIFSKDSNKALQGFYQELSDLSSAAARLVSDSSGSVFNDRTASSSNEKILTASAWDAFSADSGATEATYQIQVQQLAQAQENAGSSLQSKATGLLQSGTYNFEINVNGQNHAFSIDVSGTETNEELLSKVGQAINNANIGISAQVVADTEAGTSQLVLSSDQTGAAAAFTITDTTGDLVNQTGLGTVKTQAQNAAYRVDGKDYTGSSNTVYLDDGAVQADLKATGNVTLTVGPDAQKEQAAVTNLVTALNDYRDYINNNETYIQDSALSPIQNVMDDLKNQLGALGITQKEDGTLSVDQAKLKTALQQPSLKIKELLGGVDGIASQIESIVSNLSSTSPLTFAKEAEQLQTNFEDYIYNSSASMLKQILEGTLLNEYI